MTKETKTKQKQTVYLNRKNYPETIQDIVQEAKKDGVKSLSNMAAILITEAVQARRKTA
jgi:hypothetical protein